MGVVMQTAATSIFMETNYELSIKNILN